MARDDELMRWGKVMQITWLAMQPPRGYGIGNLCLFEYSRTGQNKQAAASYAREDLATGIAIRVEHYLHFEGVACRYLT